MPTGTPSRRGFTLAGPSISLDPRTHAVRRDLADIRLADRVFAPHYVVAMPRVLIRATRLCATPAADAAADAADSAATIAELDAGEVFEVLELAGRHAWGVAATRGLVGYIDGAALGSAPVADRA